MQSKMPSYSQKRLANMSEPVLSIDPRHAARFPVCQPATFSTYNSISFAGMCVKDISTGKLTMLIQPTASIIGAVGNHTNKESRLSLHSQLCERHTILKGTNKSLFIMFGNRAHLNENLQRSDCERCKAEIFRCVLEV